MLFDAGSDVVDVLKGLLEWTPDTLNFKNVTTAKTNNDAFRDLTPEVMNDIQELTIPSLSSDGFMNKPKMLDDEFRKKLEGCELLFKGRTISSEGDLESLLRPLMETLVSGLDDVKLVKCQYGDLEADLWTITIDDSVLVGAFEWKLRGSYRDLDTFDKLIKAVKERSSVIYSNVKQLYSYLAHALFASGSDSCYGVLSCYEKSILMKVSQPAVAGSLPSLSLSAPIGLDNRFVLFLLYSLSLMSGTALDIHTRHVVVTAISDPTLTENLPVAATKTMARATPEDLGKSDLTFHHEHVPFTQGGFGSIYRCYFKKDGDWRLCIGKKAKCDTDESLCREKKGLERCKQVCNDFFAECSYGQKCKEIIPAYVVLTDTNQSNSDWIIMEEVMPMNQYLVKYPRRSGRILKQALADALSKLHAAGVAHGDIADRNIGFLGSDGNQLVFIDFGCSSIDGDIDYEAKKKKDERDIQCVINECRIKDV